ncbi:MAG: hypothetical protein MUC65_07120 [Pontiellaceae bacterium]|jgi:hypothetical protein|nr:hypothetical protein [Pontiellaceae bacterium]
MNSLELQNVQDDNSDPSLNSLCATIKPLAQQLAAVQKQADAMGLFANDRELLECSQCGLMEDVTHSGLLITCRESAIAQDTGLRFTKESDQTFRCPSCGALVTEPLAAELEKARKQLEMRK